MDNYFLKNFIKTTLALAQKFFFMLLYIKGTSATKKVLLATAGFCNYIISEAKVGVEAQGFIKDFVFTNQGQCDLPNFPLAPGKILYYKRTNKGGPTSGIYVRICLAAGAFNYINRSLKAGVRGQGFQCPGQRLQLRYQSRRGKTKQRR